MLEPLKATLKNVLGRVGLELRPLAALPEATPEDLRLIHSVEADTMTSVERRWSTLISVRYVVRSNIAGAFVECGVWRGGQSALAAMTFQRENDLRDLWLFDTFAGMTKPTEADVNLFGPSTHKTYEKSRRGDVNLWAYAPLDYVKNTMMKTGYPVEKMHFVQGAVEKTLREHELPPSIAVLRLDTDWYESTKVEMEVLYPRLARGGVLMIDDYGHYAGSRRAVDEYFSEAGIVPLLQPIDYTGRIFVKP
jgi:hypothetical protein